MVDYEKKWKNFLKIADTIHTLAKPARIGMAMVAVKIANELAHNDYFNDDDTRLERYLELLPKVAEYLDGNADAIKDAVSDYFRIEHLKMGVDEKLFGITFFPKKSGVQTGLICDVNNGTQTVRYFIKTHQNGPTEENMKSLGPPDAKEILIYEILHLIGMGPEPRFIRPYHGTRKTLYIATKECKLELLSKLTKESANKKALIQLDLISRILCLRDCPTNSSNCGQVGDKPMIVDFRIEKEPNGYVKPDLLERFYEGNGEFVYTGLMETAMKSTLEKEKLQILNESLNEWKLLENIDKAVLKVNQTIKNSPIMFENDLERFIPDVKATIQILTKMCSK